MCIIKELKKRKEKRLEKIRIEKEEQERRRKEIHETLKAMQTKAAQTPPPVDETKYYVAISKALPFEPQDDEIIFIEPEENPWLEAFIEEYYDDIVELFRSRKMRFVYMPRMIQGLNQERLDYNYPGMSFQPQSLTNAEVVKRFYLTFFDNALSPMPRTPLLLRFKRFNTYNKKFPGGNPGSEVGEFYVFSHFSLPTEPSRKQTRQATYKEDVRKEETIASSAVETKPLSDSEERRDELVPILRDYLSNVGENIYFSLGPKPLSTLTAEEHQLIEEINERVEKLRNKGVSEMVIKSLFDVPKVQASHLRISNDFRFYLTDYDNREVKMSVLPKVLYLFYLKHPEGVTFKDLSRHKKELMGYYKQISNRVDLQKMELSIKNLGNSESNSVYEKCSLIRAAFLREFDESVVDDFLVKELGEHKRVVKVNRDLIVDETGIL
ncbi:MAG: hypothetical protein KBT04_05535 [Bacteroidales bacterium]|nr:hypothetical protein [Candidatus Colimorpha onthohippi]